MKNFKNVEIRRILQKNQETNGLTLKEMEKIISKCSTSEKAIYILGGYLDSLLEIADMINCNLDMTYGTVKNFSVVLSALYNVQRKTYHPYMNAEIIGKTISTYLTLLCVNEHGCSLEYRNMISKKMSREQLNKLLENSVSGISIMTGTKKKIDFYNAGQRCVNNPLIQIEKGLFVDMSPAISAYLEATGIDLNEYGISSIMINPEME